MAAVIQVEGLRKAYGATIAVAGVGFEVARGETFALIGPNGAGKTTTIECIEGQRRPDAGSVRVLGLDPLGEGRELRERIGVQLQQSGMARRLRVWEALHLFASFYRRPVPWRPLLERLGLGDKQDTPFAELSGGQKQRLFIALALVNGPEIVFLDEFSSGLDPQARRGMWDHVREIASGGTTVFLTTHLMEEAEKLADRVAIMDRGRLIALDTPRGLIRSAKLESRLVFEVDGPFDGSRLASLPMVHRVETGRGQVVVHGEDGFLGAVVQTLDRQGCRYRDLRTETSSLEDVFLTLTGRELRD